MDALRSIVRHLTHDLYLLRDGYNLIPLRRNLARTQYLTLEDLQTLQQERLRDLLEYVFQKNSFHRQRMLLAGLELTDLADPRILETIPVMTKDDLRGRVEELFSDGFGPGNTVHKRTGGSTGVPIHVYVDPPAMAFKKALTERHNSWAGYRPGDRIACVWGDTDKPQSLRLRVRNALTDRAVYLDTLRFTPDKIDEFLSKIDRLRSRILLGHAHSVFRLARHIEDRGITPPRFAGIITTAMTLSHTERQTIQSVLDSPVFDRYGCEEASIIASECEAHTGLHVAAEGVLVEVLSERPGVPGRILITDLTNRAMPLIRYEIGDYGMLASGACPCGRSLPRLREVSGRIADFLHTPQGEPVFGISILDTFMIHIPGIRQIQIIQDRLEHLDLYVVRESSFNEESTVQLDRAIESVFTSAMLYDIHFVDSIGLTDQGKYRFSISRISR